MARSNFRRRRGPVHKRSLNWTGASISNTLVLEEASPILTESSLLLLSADVGPGAGQVIENDGVTITRIVGTLQVAFAPGNIDGIVGVRWAFGFLKGSEPFDNTIEPSLESPDDLSTFDWLHVIHDSASVTSAPDGQPMFDRSVRYPIDIRVQRLFRQQDFLRLHAQANASLLVDTEVINFSYRADLRILLRMR